MAQNKMSFKIESNVREVNGEMKSKIGKALYLIGIKWQTICKKEITVRGIVDTGALRNSMTFKVDNSKKVVEVGSALKYAARQEFENRKGPFLRPSILDYNESYQNIIKSVMES